MRTILGIEEIDQQLFAKVVRTPYATDVPGLRPIPLHPGQLPSLDVNAAVLKRGMAVRDALRQHKGISSILDSLGKVMHPSVSPLFVQLSPSIAELINWEMLCDAKDAFVALDKRWPISRIIDPVYAPSRPPCEFTKEIRLMAVISALGIPDQRAEWIALRDAVLQARRKGLSVRLNVMIGPPGLFDEVQAEIEGGLSNVELSPIEDSSSGMTRKIREWAPNILHIFCHGQSDALGHSLELATANDHRRLVPGDPYGVIGSVRVTSDDLAGLANSLPNAWLLVLNCCSSGKAGVGLHSIAGQTVSNGFPAVVAMLEPVTHNDAYQFSRAFYPEVFVALRNVCNTLASKASASIEWTQAMYYARRAIVELNGRDARMAPEWSLPALYLRGLEAQTFIQPLGEGGDWSQEHLERFQVKVIKMAEWLRCSGQQLTPGERLSVMTEALNGAGVPQKIWPNENGEFTNDQS